jgi:hypothetical protein
VERNLLNFWQGLRRSEQELEQEKEVETEIEVEILHQTPAHDVDWNYSLVGQWRTVDYLRNGVISPLSEVVQSIIKYESSSPRHMISWPTNIYCSQNFVNTLATSISSGPRVLNNYLRPVNALLCVEKDIILISEMELNNLLPYFWRGPALASRNSRVRLMNFSFLETRRDTLPIPLSLHLDLSPSSSPQDLSILALQVFNGDPMYGNRQSLLQTLLIEKDSGKKNAIELVSMRGKIHQFDKSDLDFFDAD